MAKTIAAALAMACVAAGAARAAAASTEPADSPAEAHRRLFSRYAARADAVRKLAAQIGERKIAPGTKVKDLLAPSGAAGIALEACLSGLNETSEPNYAADGTCEVELAVTVEAAAAALEHIHARYGKGEKVTTRPFDAIVDATEAATITATGRAGVPAGFGPPRGVPKDPPAGFGVPAGAAAFWAAHCSPSGARSAERAARLDGLGRLAERINDVHVTAETTLRAFLAASDDPNVDPRTFLKGARLTAVRYHADALIVEADLEADLRTVYASLRSWAKRHFRPGRGWIEKLDELAIRAADRTVTETGVGVPPDEEMRAPTAGMRQAAALARATPAWVSRSLRAAGKGATRPAAERDARIHLAELIHRLPIVAPITVGDLAAAGGDIRTAVLIVQQGARVGGGPAASTPDGQVSVTVEIELAGLWRAILYGPKQRSTSR